MKIPCDRCNEKSEAYYTLSHKTKGLWINCKKCGTHAARFKEGLKIPYKPSKSYVVEVLSLI